MVLARHFEIGGDYARAARHYGSAAEAALAASDLVAAIQRATQALKYDARQVGVLELVCAEAHYFGGDLASAVECARRAVASLAPATQEWFRAVSWLVTSAGQRGDNDEVVRWLDPVTSAEPLPVARAAQSICLSRIFSQLVIAAGGMKTLAPYRQRAHDLARDIEDSEPQAAAWWARVEAGFAFRASDFGAVLAAGQRQADAYHRCADERGLCFTRITLGTVHVLLGEFERAETSIAQGIAIAERLGIDYLRNWAKFTLGKSLALRGDLPRAREHLETAMAAVATSPRFAGSAGIYLSLAAFIAGDYALGIGAATRVLAMKIGPPLRAAALAALARSELRSGRRPKALEHVTEAFAILAELVEIEEFETLLRLAYAEALRDCGRDEARPAIDEARRRVLAIAAKLDTAHKDSFLTRVPENVATLAL